MFRLQVRIFTFSVGQHNYDKGPIQWMACSNKGARQPDRCRLPLTVRVSDILRLLLSFRVTFKFGAKKLWVSCVQVTSMKFPPLEPSG